MSGWERAHPEPHYVTRSGWLRAAVLGANDGIVSISALIVGVAAAEPSLRGVLIAGVAGLTAGAMSMAAGEYVSVSSQADLERADIERERRALESNPHGELAELAAIYRARGLSAETAERVAHELTEADALAAHKRDELGLTEEQAARPIVAAAASGVTFTVAGAVPVIAAAMAPAGLIIPTVVAITVAALFALGALGALAGGANVIRGALRVAVWGGVAMAVTAAVGRLFGVAV